MGAALAAELPPSFAGNTDRKEPSVKAKHHGRVPATGTFGAFRAPAVVGVSDDVRLATRSLARRAKRAERQWLKTLPKGVMV
jgi:hypothetical protein